MALTLEEIAEATANVTLPDDPAELRRARGDATPDKVETVDVKAAEPAEPEKELTEDEKAEVEEEVKPEAKEEEPARDPETGKFVAKDKDEGVRIPKPRFDQMRNKLTAQLETERQRNQELEARLKEKEGPQSVDEAETELEAQTKKYQNLLADGRMDEAAQVMKGINRLNRQIARLETLPQLQQHTAEQQATAALGQMIDLYTTHFPEFLNGTSEYSQELVNEVAELQTGYQNVGYPPADALAKAADMVIKANHLQPLGERGKTKPHAVDKNASRKSEAVEKNIDAAGRQPPNAAGIGKNSDSAGAHKIDPNTLTQDEFEKLPEATVKRLRGDLAA